MGSGLGITEVQRDLYASVRGWATRNGVRTETRSAAEGGGKTPIFWTGLGAQGLLGMAVPEGYGGDNAGVVELAVALEALGYELAPGPHLATMAAGAIINGFGNDELRSATLPTIAAASAVIGIAVGADRLTFADGRLTGMLGSVLGAGQATSVVVPAVGANGVDEWFVISVASVDGDVAQPGVDPTRPIGTMRIDAGANQPLVGLSTNKVQHLLALLIAAESAGIAAWCLDTAVAYALVREQFGALIGSFQAVKHRCADMLVQVELARAAVWDAAAIADDATGQLKGRGRTDVAEEVTDGLETAVAAVIAIEAAVTCAKGVIQVLGGIGYTWEHDAHLYLKRALANRALIGGVTRWKREAALLTLRGAPRSRSVELPVEAEAFRAEVRAFLRTLEGLTAHEQRRQIADAGYLVAHWPKPFGRGAGAVEQIVVAQEFEEAGVSRADLVIGNWALPPILASGTDAQRERFARPTLYGEISWCQLFSEPGAGSDLASLQTKAKRVEGGWSLSGQKVWTSMAATADWAICLARTSSGAKRHDGITYFLLDMHTPGVDVRPLRELTGHALFNEVFLTDVFIPDDCVVGDVDGGWRLARTTLANERVSMSSSSSFPSGIAELIDAVQEAGVQDDVGVLERVGALVCLGQADAALGLRSTLAQVSGIDPGASSSVRKLVGMHLRQDASELILELLGEQILTDAEVPVLRFLANRALTIAGGTSEVLRNVVGERVLGLPR